MKNFKINNPNEPEPAVAYNSYVPGTRFTFSNIGGQIKAAMSIPVTILN